MTTYKCCKQIFLPNAFAIHLEHTHGIVGEFTGTCRQVAMTKNDEKTIVLYEWRVGELSFWQINTESWHEAF